MAHQLNVGDLFPDFTVAYSLEVPRDADKIGAFWDDRHKIFHATNFILNPKGKMVSASYSTGPIGRIVAEDALSYIRFQKKRAQQKT